MQEWNALVECIDGMHRYNISEYGYNNQMTTPAEEGSAPKQYNMFNLTRLQKVSKANELEVVEDNNSGSRTDVRQLFSYKVMNNDAPRQISPLYLNNRLLDIKKQELEKLHYDDNLSHPSIEKANEKANEKAVEEEVTEERRITRYFDEGETMEQGTKCFRCDKFGHIAKNCFEEQSSKKCLYCMGAHENYECGERICFRCNEVGHVSQECHAQGVKCHKCDKIGHAAKYCGVIQFPDYRHNQAEGRYEEEDLRRLKCMANCKKPYGHFNCFVYLRKTPLPYEEVESSESNQSISKNHSFDRNPERDYSAQRNYSNHRNYESRRNYEEERIPYTNHNYQFDRQTNYNRKDRSYEEQPYYGRKPSRQNYQRGYRK